MKKILLFLLCIPLIAVAQIGEINPQANRYEYVTDCIMLDHQTNEVRLTIFSDNEFEDEVVSVILGASYDESIISLQNLLAAFGTPNSNFELQGYRFSVLSDRLYVLPSKNILYTAGDYVLWKIKVEDIIKKLKQNKDKFVTNR